MKIAILSMQKVYNYGSVLQAYSLKKIVEEVSGEKVDFLNPKYDRYLPADMILNAKSDYDNNKYIGNRIEFIAKKIINKIKFKEFVKEIVKFQKEKLKLSDDNDLNVYDLVIEGSDEVFKCTKKYIYIYMEKWKIPKD